jgi:hypothetical protein
MAGLASVAAALALAPAAAAADTFYVDDDASPSAGPCNTPASKCQTITAAVDDARATPDVDRILVDPGTYVEHVTLNNSNDGGLTIDGAGDATVVRHPGSAPSHVFNLGASGITVRELAVEALTATGLQLGNSANGARLVDLSVTGTADGISLGTSDVALVERARISMGGTNSRGVLDVGIANEVRDSTIASGAAAIEMGGSDMLVARSVLRGTDSAGAVLFATGGDGAIESSLIVGGGQGVHSYAGGTSTKRVRLRGVTIDVESAKVADAGDGVRSRADPGATSNVIVENSIVLEPQAVTGGGVATVTCSSSDVPDQAEALGDDSIACGNAAGNTTSSPLALFTGGADWHLVPGSPAVDSGSTAGLGGGESATDLDGNPRVLDGDRDCLARRDKGAYELIGQAAACPPPPPPGVDLAPFLGSLRTTNRVFRVPPLASQRRRANIGTRFLYLLSEAARVSFTIERRTIGRRVRGSCRKLSRRNLRRRRCVRWVRVRGFAFAEDGVQGANSTPFTGRIGRRALRPGRYRASARATDPAGNRSALRRVSFRVVRR